MNWKQIAARVIALLLTSIVCQDSIAQDQPAPLTPPDVWYEFDPDEGDFKEEIIKEETRGGVLSRESNMPKVNMVCLQRSK